MFNSQACPKVGTIVLPDDPLRLSMTSAAWLMSKTATPAILASQRILLTISACFLLF